MRQTSLLLFGQDAPCNDSRQDEPDYSAIPEPVYDWAHSVYFGDVKEVIPDDCPDPALGNYVTLSHFIDANLYHDMITGHSVTGTLHLLNKMPH